MDWKKKLSRGFNQGLDQSINLLGKAKKQAKDIGEQTVLNLEIQELKKKESSLYESLGRNIYHLLMNSERSSVSVKTAEIRDIFPEIQRVTEELSSKQMLVKKEEKNRNNS